MSRYDFACDYLNQFYTKKSKFKSIFQEKI